MPELNDNDIVNRIAEVLKRQGNSTIRYDVVDLQSRVPEGSTARFLRVAVEDAGMEVVREEYPPDCELSLFLTNLVCEDNKVNFTELTTGRRELFASRSETNYGIEYSPGCK